jgi:hypothetical protein
VDVAAISPAAWNMAGLVIATAGVLLLFIYGMPYRVRTGGASGLLLNEIDQQAIREERRYDVLGWIGLVLVLIGTAFQIVANLV